jgi:hypothetical protein
LHQRHTGHLGKPPALDGLLGLGDNPALNLAVRKLHPGLIGLVAYTHSVVEHHPAASEDPR